MLISCTAFFFFADYLIWGHFLSISKYSFTGFIVNEYSGASFSGCDGDDDGGSGGGSVCFDSGEEVLEFYDVEDVNKWLFLLYNSLFYLGYSFLTYLGLVFIRHERR